jgi:hypothetical protein
MSQSDTAISNHPPAIQTENLPKIGIRPTIDRRRRGVREALKNRTWSAFGARNYTSDDHRACTYFALIYV